MTRAMAVPDAVTVAELVARYEQEGFASQFAAALGARVRCTRCGEESPAARTPVHAVARAEGASDPDDMALVAALACPACGTKGVLVAGYGPTASPEDASVVAELPDRHAHDGDPAVLHPGDGSS